jgi:predicted DCC family thiol-disulfide oxidoreductase YuxK
MPVPRTADGALARAATLALVTHLVAGLAMALVLARGLDPNAELADRLGFIAAHRAVWSAAWATWSLAALSILFFYWAFVSRHWRDPLAARPALLLALVLAVLAVAADVSGELIEVTLIPGLADGPATELLAWQRRAVVLMSVVGNGLYTAMAVLLAAACRRSYPGWVGAVAGAVGLAGAAHSLATLLGLATGASWASLVLAPALLGWLAGVAIAAVRRANLAAPAESRPLVVYDGACGICAGNLPWLYRLDWLQVFDALPYQSDEVYRRVPRLTRAECETALQLALPDGRIYSGADAFREVFLRMPGTAPVGALMALPPLGGLLRRLYPVLARNRYKLGGQCHLPGRPQGPVLPAPAPTPGWPE